MRLVQRALLRRRIATICVGVVCIAGTAGGQQRVMDALIAADYASGSLSAIQCSASLPELPALPPMPGAAAGSVVRPREWFYAAALGAAGDSHRTYGTAVARARFVRDAWCAFDLGITAAGTTSGAASGTLDVRYLLGRNAWAPAIELGASIRTSGTHASDAGAGPDASARLSVTTPNLWAATVGRVGEPVLGDWWPRLDLRARLYGGIDESSELQAGGVLVANLLQKPVALLVSSAHDGAAARDGLGAAYRVPCCGDFGWLVARAVRHRSGRSSSTEYRIEFAQLVLSTR